jgi:predicted DNA repair protein MutK
MEVFFPIFVVQKFNSMASGIFAILDDIAALMDDVAVATKKTAGILGDDLAVNAEKATGFLSSREIPVLWAITKGSFVNKLIIVPIAFLLNILFPAAIIIILLLGGLYLAYEGVEKIIHYFMHTPKTGEDVLEEIQDDATLEKAKIKSAITTDFILSIEIVIIALGSVLEKPLPLQIITVGIVAIVATVGVYGIVALIVRMDDAGYKLIKKSDDKGFLAVIGGGLVKALPLIIRALGAIGTVALLLVSGGIFDHNIEALHSLFPSVPEMVKQLCYGIVAGLAVFVLIWCATKLYALVKK